MNINSIFSLSLSLSLSLSPSTTIVYFTATLVTGIQIAIVVLGRFDQLRFEEQAECFNTSVNYRLQEAGFDNSTFNIETLTNFTYPVRQYCTIIVFLVFCL